jgi:hypothetical protein
VLMFTGIETTVSQLFRNTSCDTSYLRYEP